MQSHLISPLIAAGFVVFWSSGFIGGRLAVESTMPVLTLFVWRFALATVAIVLVWGLWTRERVSWAGLLQEAAIGSLTMGGYLLGVTLAIEAGVSAGVTALIAAMQPLLSASLAGYWLGECLSLRGWIGMVIAAAGVVLCVADDMGSGAGVSYWAYALPLLSVLSVTLGSVLAVRWSTAAPMVPTLAAQLLAATVVFAVAAAAMGYAGRWMPALDPVTLGATFWLIVLSSVGGYGCFVASLRRLGVTFTSTLVFLTPPVTMIWAGLMFGENPGAWGVIGMGVAIAGVAMAMVPTDPTDRASATPADNRQTCVKGH